MAPPPGSRATPVVLSPGDLLAARYRLVRRVSDDEQHRPGGLWLASDEVLARPVAAKVLPVTGPDAAATSSRFLDAATAAGSLASPGLVRVYDASVEQRAQVSGPPVDVAYVISEWVDGEPLSEALRRDGPVAPDEAVALVAPLAEALTVAHAAGLPHGRVHPGNVLVARSGAARLTDLGVSAAMPDGSVAQARADDPDPLEADVRDLAAVLYALLTARWPAVATPQPSGGVEPSPVLREGDDRRGRLASPRQVRAGVPRALDAVVARALDPQAARQAPALTTAAGLLDAVEAAVRADPPAAARLRRRPRLPSGLRRVLPVVVVGAALVAIGAAAFSAGRDIGAVEPSPDAVAATAAPSAGEAAAAAPLDLSAIAVRDFDPEGDGTERPGSVANAVDGDLTTTWDTERYDTEAFGGLKDGVGLLLDLGAPATVTQADLVLSRAGVGVEVRAADTAAETADGYRVVARGAADSERLTLPLLEGTTARYYLVWFTDLAPEDSRFSAGIADLVLQGVPAA